MVLDVWQATMMRAFARRQIKDGTIVLEDDEEEEEEEKEEAGGSPEWDEEEWGPKDLDQLMQVDPPSEPSGQ